MSTISNSWDSSYYNKNADYSDLFSNLGTTSGSSSSFSLSDYASIKNGSYRKLLNAYYAKQNAEKASGSSDSSQTLTRMQTGADALKKSAETLMDDSLWEKKEITKKDEKTGEETKTLDYDWEKITKAVKTFIEDYNTVVKQAGDSNATGVLRSAAWMTQKTKAYSSLLSQVGISITKDNTLELDEEALKESNGNTLKTLFSGNSSYVSQISQKASAISNAAAGANKTASYTKNGTYKAALSSMASGKIDKEA